uniref:F-box domain and ankyrin repeat protein n=1 Tax=Pithovirus LCPAC304 TaxID=2506594 RepID=A0A481Z893_9VIRU|nr:MAG: F-box domain and ankyrin repeat protein [Pithovirus LCPAC304]
MEGESYLDLLPPEIGAQINRLLKANPTFAVLMDLPYEVRMHVVVQMPYPDVLRFCATSTEAKKVCDDDYFWKLKVAHDFPGKTDKRHRLYGTGLWHGKKQRKGKHGLHPGKREYQELYGLWLGKEKEESGGRDLYGPWPGKYRNLWHQLYEEAHIKLYLCAKEGHLKCVKSLLQLGIDPDSYTSLYRTTALLWASKGGHTDVVRLLLEHGANPNLKNNAGYSARKSAKQYKHADIVQLFSDK